jgi:hypothetical protein
MSIESVSDKKMVPCPFTSSLIQVAIEELSISVNYLNWLSLTGERRRKNC